MPQPGKVVQAPPGFPNLNPGNQMMFGKNSEFIESRPIIHYPLMINYGSRRGGRGTALLETFCDWGLQSLAFFVRKF